MTESCSCDCCRSSEQQPDVDRCRSSEQHPDVDCCRSSDQHPDVNCCRSSEQHPDDDCCQCSEQHPDVDCCQCSEQHSDVDCCQCSEQHSDVDCCRSLEQQADVDCLDLPGPRTDEIYRTVNIPIRFMYPKIFKGYRQVEQPNLHPCYRSTSMDYGWFSPTVHTVPTCYYPRNCTFSVIASRGGMWRNCSLNTGLDK